ncbi:hypothetical protein ABZ721_38760, partial [Streptomyces sp. NPDC006733]|uniref:hypothetical protein n=1 Tax=Streptomyces sp. NPDC006733 TaxID=3155460 RepID=UPI0033C5AC55
MTTSPGKHRSFQVPKYIEQRSKRITAGNAEAPASGSWTELAQFNIEVNIAPHHLSGRVLDRL